MNIIKLYQDYNVEYAPEGDKHTRPGWINTECPFCVGNPGFHLGFDTAEPHYYCWRCGWHPISLTISRLLKITEQEARKILHHYDISVPNIEIAKIKPIRTAVHQLPSGICPLGPTHRKYLEKRHYDPDRLIRQWSLIGTGPVSQLDGIDYKHRILIPYHWNGEQVSFDTRDITNHSPQRYRACPLNREQIPHKAILYGKQEAWTKTGICVEGTTDTWRLGVNAFAVSGIEYTRAQVRLMSRLFSRVFVMFDDDPQAVVKADELISELRFRGVESYRVDIEGDPGGMKQDDADHLVRNLLLKK